ncbi:hypothetical protein P692DRAFT_2061227 [Suillus brevipes Sb2]|nr:hypothetical protein P692DRAFT_2061227 [Suillus brevipes Sb2]
MCASSDLYLSFDSPMHLRFLRILYRSVNVGPYSEDSVANFSQDVDCIDGAMLYMNWGCRFVTEAVANVHQAVFDSYSVGTKQASIPHSCVPIHFAVDRDDDPGCWSSSTLSHLSFNRT